MMQCMVPILKKKERIVNAKFKENTQKLRRRRNDAKSLQFFMGHVLL